MSFETKCLQAQRDADPTINDKVATRALLKSWGYPTADLLAYVPDPALLAPYLDGLVVVKPRNGSTSHGVHALQDMNCLICHRTFTVESLAADISAWNQKFGWTEGAIVETALLHRGELAYEYKAYCFDRPRLIQGRHHSDRYAWWSEGERVRVGKLDRKLDPDFPPPPEGLEELAQSVRERFPWLGFMRIDCYWTDDGWKVGELADHVGNRWFNREWDRRLGEWWS